MLCLYCEVIVRIQCEKVMWLLYMKHVDKLNDFDHCKVIDIHVQMTVVTVY
jgi:hypothetical protein